jgi:Ras-related protein Rab-7A
VGNAKNLRRDIDVE